MPLKASELTQAMEEGFAQAWLKVKGPPRPAGSGDRTLLFEGVARGLLQFIHDHQNEVLTRVTFQEAGLDAETHTVVGAVFDIAMEE